MCVCWGSNPAVGAIIKCLSTYVKIADKKNRNNSFTRCLFFGVANWFLQSQRYLKMWWLSYVFLVQPQHHSTNDTIPQQQWPQLQISKLSKTITSSLLLMFASLPIPTPSSSQQQGQEFRRNKGDQLFPHEEGVQGRALKLRRDGRGQAAKGRTKEVWE